MKSLAITAAALLLPFPLVWVITQAWVALAGSIPPAVQAPALYAAWAWAASLSAIALWRQLPRT